MRNTKVYIIGSLALALVLSLEYSDSQVDLVVIHPTEPTQDLRGLELTDMFIDEAYSLEFKDLKVNYAEVLEDAPGLELIPVEVPNVERFEKFAPVAGKGGRDPPVRIINNPKQLRLAKSDLLFTQLPRALI